MTTFNIGDEVRFISAGLFKVAEYRGVVTAVTEKGYRVDWAITGNRNHSVDYPAESLELIRPAKAER
jgi:hypothetical protein